MKQDKKNSLVAVVMSTYNTNEEHLKLAIESILHQSMKDFIFYIVIDGGRDKEIVSKYKDERIILIEHEESKGLAFSLNEVIEKCNSDYLMRMDSDDISLPNRMLLQYEFMEKNKDIDISAMVGKKIGNEHRFVYSIWNDSYAVNCQLLYATILMHPTIMFRMSSVKKYNIRYDTGFQYSQDYELWTRFVGKANYRIIPRVGLLYRMHNNQISTSKKSIQDALAMKVLQRNIGEIGLNNQYITVLRVLSGRQNDYDMVEVADMIDDIILQCKNNPKYSQKVMKKVLYCIYAVNVLKKKDSFNVIFTHKTVWKKIVRLDLLVYFMRKIFFEIWYRIDLKINIGRTSVR